MPCAHTSFLEMSNRIAPDLKVGIGQCVAKMIAALRFNQEKGGLIKVLYGSVTKIIQSRPQTKFLVSWYG